MVFMPETDKKPPVIVMAHGLGRTREMRLYEYAGRFAAVFPSVIHAVPSRFGEKYSADITGFHMGGAYAMGFLSQLALGYAATGISFRIMPFVLICLLGLMLLCNELAGKKAKKYNIPVNRV